MISNSLTLSSKKFNTITIKRKNLKRNITQINQLRQHKLNLQMTQSRNNLFNFIKNNESFL